MNVCLPSTPETSLRVGLSAWKRKTDHSERLGGGGVNEKKQYDEEEEEREVIEVKRRRKEELDLSM